MTVLDIKPEFECRWNLVSLGEVMLRFDPGDERIHTTRQFRVFEGGGEYNVARSLRKVFAQRTAIVTALTRNPIGSLIEDLILQGGVDTSQILWRSSEIDQTRNGIYFIERGFGLRAPSSCFDREHTAVSQIQSHEIDWNLIFGEIKTQWFHTGGIFAGLSDSTPQIAALAMQIASQQGAMVSYDLNYRNSLWKTRGGRLAANEVNNRLLPFADVVFGVPDFDSKLSRFDERQFTAAAEKLHAQFPNVKIIATTLREVESANRHNFGGTIWTNQGVFTARNYFKTEVFDRVGSGDAFASGVIYGLLTGEGEQFAVDCGTAHAVLAMTTPGDNSMATSDEVRQLMQEMNAEAKR
ncbi:MAG: sugar kinase [Pyrinomonadaceae bacterium]